MDRKLASIIKYFAVFEYFPSFEDVYTFFPEKISKKKLKTIYEAGKYTVGEYSKKISNIKYQISKRKLKNWRFRSYIKLISLFPQIELVGLSGSIAMMNAKENDDIDLFIITSKNRLFTGRFIALALAQILGLRRRRGSEKQFLLQRESHHSDYRRNGPLESEKIAFSSSNKDKICLNLFFDESNQKVPRFKQTLFVGHEVLQMKPIINKDNVYGRFLKANGWVFKLFPNAKQIFNFQFSIFNENFKFQISNLGDYIENLLKKLQLYLIRKHQTTEIITDTQLWFHPEDFGKKIEIN